ncbi:hypothetical protein KCP71_10965 [Salmonella enterica subsp. enterica]|nr:hypothetical protein KCP71_10965 [Salmonella enterica subsp. enterica]
MGCALLRSVGRICIYAAIRHRSHSKNTGWQLRLIRPTVLTLFRFREEQIVQSVDVAIVGGGMVGIGCRLRLAGERFARCGTGSRCPRRWRTMRRLRLRVGD